MTSLIHSILKIEGSEKPILFFWGLKKGLKLSFFTPSHRKSWSFLSEQRYILQEFKFPLRWKIIQEIQLHISFDVMSTSWSSYCCQIKWVKICFFLWNVFASLVNNCHRGCPICIIVKKRPFQKYTWGGLFKIYIWGVFYLFFEQY